MSNRRFLHLEIGRIGKSEDAHSGWLICQDRYASIGTGWPMTLDEADILTNLPASEEAFLQEVAQNRQLQLADVLNGEGTDSISSFSGVILLSTLYGQELDTSSPTQ